MSVNEKMQRDLIRYLRRGITDFDMIAPNDRIAVAVSGGEDSIALLYLLSYFKNESKTPFSIAAIHTPGDSEGKMVKGPHPPLDHYLKNSGIERFYAPFELGEDDNPPLPCSRCARLKRSAIFKVAKKEGYCTVAFGHHADDMIDTAMMNLILHGRFTGFHPVKRWFDNQIKVIRPLIYIPKRKLSRLALQASFPSPPPECKRGLDTPRVYAARLIEGIQEQYGSARKNIFWAALKAMGYKSVKRNKQRPII